MTAAELYRALAATPPRSAQVLTHRLLDGRSREQCAALYGITLEAWDFLFLRAAVDFQRARGTRAPAPTFEEERRQAAQLAERLSPELQQLETQRDEVRAIIDQAEAAAEASPARAREVWLRRIAIAVIIALTAYFYRRQQLAEKSKKPIPYVPYLTEPKK